MKKKTWAQKLKHENFQVRKELENCQLALSETMKALDRALKEPEQAAKRKEFAETLQQNLIATAPVAGYTSSTTQLITLSSMQTVQERNCNLQGHHIVRHQLTVEKILMCDKCGHTLAEIRG